MEMQFVCPKCGNIIAPDELFCSHCGAKLSDKNQTIGIGKQIWIYFVTLFLPPLGLIWTWKFIRSDSPQKKRIGWITLLLTIIAVVVTIWITVGFLQGISNQINSVSNFSTFEESQ